MAEVVLEHIYKIYRGDKGSEVTAVTDFNLAIRDREFVVLVGPSGCGKSTTLRMVAGLEEISRGELRIDGRRMNDVAPKDRDIAMVFQNYALYPHMTVGENMAFGLKLRNLPRAEIEARVADAARILGLSDEMLRRKPAALSGGQRQRVAVGRAIVRKPKAFLFDEPLSNLDAKMRVQMRAEITRLHRELEGTMIYVTHDQVEAMTMGDRIVVMKDGVVQQAADPLTIYNRPANLFVAGFIGSPAMSLLRGRITRGGGGLEFAEEGGPVRLPIPGARAGALAEWEGKPVLLGLRPEDVTERSQAGDLAGRAVVEAVAETSEPLGAETFFHLTTGAHRLIARAKGHHKVNAGARLELAADLERAHFFDPTTERAIGG
jgi:multiple sugar transport system ATP-binding protein